MVEFPIFGEQVLRSESALYGCAACPWKCGWPVPPPSDSDLPEADFDGYGY